MVKEKRPILRNRFYLYLTEFFSGMSVMAVELGASRLMAPYFSSSQIVWTIIIGTIMIAMALGNIYGGRSADKNPDPDKLYGRILIAAIWIALIPVLGKYVILGISALLIFTVSSNFLIIAGFAACMVIFVFPLFLLGTVTPSLVKYTVDNLEDNGRLVGNLNASNTIGSIIGTFVPTFISIPTVGTSITFFIFAGILLVLAILYFVSGNGNFFRVRKLPISIVIFLICVVLGHDNSFAFWQDDLTYEGESIYNYLQVYEDDDKVVLSTNVLFGVQSVYKKEKGLTGMYYDYAMAAPFMTGINDKNEINILILGNGTGTYATQCTRYFENVNISGVEIDQKITDLAVQYFELPESVEVTTYDGRAYLNTIQEKYDVIMVDAYQDITIPFQMSSVEFFELVKEHLTDDGVMVVNMNMRGTEEGNINQYLADTISKVFSTVYTADVLGTTNRELFASNNPAMIEVFKRNTDAENNKEMKTMMGKIAPELTAYVPGDYLMTDDKAPVELLGMKVIDELIQDEIAHYKQIYKDGGLKALLRMLQ
ncbi:MAG: fused MFS/spermidine synthase [Eubacteriales bacterium]|nr:fused MFS/spermidine synthase [Eubacteriales bacterium]